MYRHLRNIKKEDVETGKILERGYFGNYFERIIPTLDKETRGGDYRGKKYIITDPEQTDRGYMAPTIGYYTSILNIVEPKITDDELGLSVSEVRSKFKDLVGITESDFRCSEEEIDKDFKEILLENEEIKKRPEVKSQ